MYFSVNLFKITFLVVWIGFFFQGHAQTAPSGDLIQDLIVVEEIDRKLNEKMPVIFNNYQQGGYLIMPSARVGCEGEVGAGYASVPPYRTWNVRCQLTDFLEVTGNYRVFKGISDPVLSHYGFGDFSDKGANVKFAFFKPEDSNYDLPGMAFGFDDIIGTRAFKSSYVVMTQVFLQHHLEMSLGYGTDRFNGFFGGFAWFPFRKKFSLLSDLCIVGEFDATRYKSHHEPHPKGRSSKTPWNIGLHYRLFDCFDFSAGYIRGEKLCFSLSTFYNFGHTKGFLPKIDNPLPYVAPVNIEPVGVRRPESVLAQDLAYAFEEQGLRLLGLFLYFDECGQRVLRLKIDNDCYRSENEVRNRLNHLLAALIPVNVQTAIVTLDVEGMEIQEYIFPMCFVRAYSDQSICPYELEVLTPLQEAPLRQCYSQWEIYKKNRDKFNIGLSPKVETFFGSSKGKFKYGLGVNLGASGYLDDTLFYSVSLGWIAISDLKNVGSVDRLNPSQLPNVRTDAPLYLRESSITIDEAYLQKTWKLGLSTYARASIGYFEQMYGGVAGEILYYPLNSWWAIGVEGAIVKKRQTKGLGFKSDIRQFHHFTPTFHRFTGTQCFVDFYARWREAGLDFKIKGGKFLANDVGARFELSRYFESGLIITLWYTRTNGHDKINGQIYHDKGICFSMPLDIFYSYSSFQRWGYGLSAWLRDVGASSATGPELYTLIRAHRE